MEQLNNDSGTVEQWNRDRETLEREEWSNDVGTVEQGTVEQ